LSRKCTFVVLKLVDIALADRVSSQPKAKTSLNRVIVALTVRVTPQLNTEQVKWFDPLQRTTALWTSSAPN
jgi:hypothetical protein